MNIECINSSLLMINNWIQSGRINDNHIIEMEISEQKNKDILKQISICKKIQKNDDIIGKKCFICNNNFKENEYKRTLKSCNHIFHKKCIDKLIIENFKCPQCDTCVFQQHLS